MKRCSVNLGEDEVEEVAFNWSTCKFKLKQTPTGMEAWVQKWGNR